MSYIWYGMAVSLAYPSGNEGGNFILQMISTCLRYDQRNGGGRGGSGSEPCGPCTVIYFNSVRYAIPNSLFIYITNLRYVWSSSMGTFCL